MRGCSGSLGFPHELGCDTLRTNCSCISERKELGLPTQTALFCGFNGAGSQRKHTHSD